MSTTPVDRPAALAALIEEYRDVPFAWGVHDCCLWAAKAVQIQTGRDPADRFRGTYKTKAEAVALIQREFGSRIEYIPGRLGFKRASLALCQRGWLVSHAFEGTGPALGICVGSKAAFAGERGLVFIATADCCKAWRVG